MKNASKPNLGKMFQQNEKVTVRTTLDRVCWKLSPEIRRLRNKAPATVLRGRVVNPWRRGARVKLTTIDGGFLYERIFRNDEGAAWVRGWDTDEALAMLAAEALR